MDSAELKALVRQLHQLTKALQQNWSAPEPDLPLPEKFSGSPGTLDHFIFDCELLFSLKPRTYSQDLIKVRTAMFLLTGRIKTRAHELVRANGASLLTWSSFVNTLVSWVGHSRSHGDVTPRKTTSLPRRARETAIFRPTTGVSSEAADVVSTRARSRRGACPIKIPDRPVPPLSETSPSTVASPVPTLNNDDDRLLLQPKEADEGSSAMSYDENDNAQEEPMEIYQIRVESPREVLARRRRRLGLCFYCGDQGHFISYCPVRPVRSVQIGLVDIAPVRPPHLLRNNPEGPSSKRKAGSSAVDHDPHIVPVGVQNPVSLGGAHELDKPNHYLGVSLKTDSKAEPCSPLVEALPGVPETRATPALAARSSLPPAEVTIPFSATPSPSVSPVLASIENAPKEDISGYDPEDSVDTAYGTDPCPYSSVPRKEEKGSDLLERHALLSQAVIDKGQELEIAEGKMRSLRETFEDLALKRGKKAPSVIKTLVASYAATLEPGCAIICASNLPDLRTPGLFDDDPYTEDDPCPLSYASDGLLVRTVDLEVYEKGLKKESKKGSKACPRVPSVAEVAQRSFESAQAISGRYLKALVASHAKVLEPGCVLDYAPGLPDLRTPGLFDDDPYTEEDPCPLSYASDGALVRTVDLGVYEKGLKKELKTCAKKSKKNKKKRG